MATPETNARSASLDGIRAVAVLAVFLYHARVTWAQGAVTSISIFFPLSGYLITRNLLREFGRTGTIRLADFWWRRARRLLPASVVAVAFTAIIAAACDIPVRAMEVVSSITGWKNWHYLADFSYGDMFVIWWSLAIEEQYYLFYPVLLLVLLLLARRSAQPRSSVLIAALAALTIASFATLLHLSRGGNPVQAYYGTHGRLWELLLGCLLAVAGGFPRRLRLPAWWALALVIAAMSPIGEHSSSWWMPPLRTVIVIIGTLQLIDSIGRSPDSWVARTLGSRPLRFVGTISYEVYLLHYAVIVAVRQFTGTPWLLVLIEVSVTLVAALGLHRLVTPLRAPSR